MTHAAPSVPRGHVRLSLRAPALAGSVILALVATAIGIAARTPFEQRIGATGLVQQLPVQSHGVRHARGGSIERVHVTVGQEVAAGDLLITLGTGALADDLARLQAEALTAERQLAAIRQEVASLATAPDTTPDRQSRIARLEVKLHEIEREGVALIRRTALAEQELARAVVRAPVAGRVAGLAEVGAAIAPGAAVADIHPALQPLTILAAVEAPAHMAIAPGAPVRVWPTSFTAAGYRPLRARVAEVADVPAAPLSPARRLLRIELSEPRAGPLVNGAAARLSIALGTHSLLDELLAPVWRLMKRASRA
jgi:multidrug efflux pump subunit AcrA (membrane-fusion protein)